MPCFFFVAQICTVKLLIKKSICMYSIAVDSRNKTAQVQLKNSVAGLTIMPFKAGVLDEGAFLEDAQVRVELVRKSQPNAVLYDMPLKALNEIWKGFQKQPKGVVLPLAFKENLLLNKDAFIQVDFSWEVGDFSTIKVAENTLAQSTNVPISFKKIQLDGDMEIDTEHFEYIFIPKTVNKIETFVDGLLNELTTNKNSSAATFTKSGAVAGRVSAVGGNTASDVNATGVNVTGNCGCTGEMKRQKIEMTYEYLSFMTNNPTEENVLFRTGANQMIKLFGEGEVILMQA